MIRKLIKVKHFFDFEPADMKAVPIAWAEVNPSDKEAGRGFVIAPLVRNEYVLFSAVLNSSLVESAAAWRRIITYCFGSRMGMISSDSFAGWRAVASRSLLA